MFDYEKFKEDLVTAMEKILRKWSEENDDIYILSLDLSRDMESVGVWANTVGYLEEQADDDTPEDFWYYKYCEEEWDLCEVISEISSYMRTYLDENSGKFSEEDSEGTSIYTESFDAHCDQIMESCKKALEGFRELTREDFPKLLLAFNIREYLDNEERIAVFSLVNSAEVAKEYAEHIEDFN